MIVEREYNDGGHQTKIIAINRFIYVEFSTIEWE